MKAPISVCAAAGFGVATAGIGSLAAHQTLYHNIEVNLHDPAVIRIFVTVHAPELPTGVAAGIDPSAVGDDWLHTRPDPELAQLLAEAARFIGQTFTFSVVPHGDAPLEPIPTESFQIEFETPEQIRDPAYDNGLPAGCFLATIALPNPGSPRGLAVAFSPEAEKRLLLAIARPGEFPEVHDLEAAESVQIDLPEAPPPAPDRILWPVAGFGIAAAAVALFAWLAFRRRAAG